MRFEEKETEIFVTCADGIEPLLMLELEKLGFSRLFLGFRGVFVKIRGLNDVYRINYCSRLAGRVLYPLAKFPCPDRNTLYKKALLIDWRQYLSHHKTFSIDANVSHHTLTNSLFAAQVVKDAICDQLREKTGSRPSVDTQSPDVQLNLYIRDRFAIMSLDTSGAPLHKRGYRQDAGSAPIQESLAAALLTLGKYQGSEIFCDLCCGSGTFLIEAAMIASATPPGFLRKEWGFKNLPQFSGTDWLRIKNEEDSKRKPLAKNRFFGCDSDPEMVRISKANFRAAGFLQDMEVSVCDFRDYRPVYAPDFMMTNPPHGKRLDDVEHLRPLYRALGAWMKQYAAKPSRGFIFTAADLAKEVGLAAKRRHVMSNSGIDCRLMEFDLF